MSMITSRTPPDAAASMVADESTATVTQAGGVENLVGQQEIVAQPGRRHALHLPDGGAGEPKVTGLVLAAGQLGALVSLDVRAQPGTGVGGGHGGQVLVEQGGIDEQGRRLELLDLPGEGREELVVHGAGDAIPRRPGTLGPGSPTSPRRPIPGPTDARTATVRS
jgi:hypothetical protein